MITDSYEYAQFPNKPVYVFQSDGQQGSILKGVIFQPMNENLWNLAFGDIINGEINDTVISNNLDFIKLFGTIAKITYILNLLMTNAKVFIIIFFVEIMKILRLFSISKET